VNEYYFFLKFFFAQVWVQETCMLIVLVMGPQKEEERVLQIIHFVSLERRWCCS